MTENKAPQYLMDDVLQYLIIDHLNDTHQVVPLGFFNAVPADRTTTFPEAFCRVVPYGMSVAMESDRKVINCHQFFMSYKTQNNGSGFTLENTNNDSMMCSYVKYACIAESPFVLLEIVINPDAWEQLNSKQRNFLTSATQTNFWRSLGYQFHYGTYSGGTKEASTAEGFWLVHRDWIAKLGRSQQVKPMSFTENVDEGDGEPKSLIYSAPIMLVTAKQAKYGFTEVINALMETCVSTKPKQVAK